ncbi:MAG TPA: rhodanese-like domain-containing protein [Candidatus Polarisedimenticolia bacterium]|nr:rhodanese-like domain-containing protein [Candidatus Polarisedimenticolia bacterium]
MKSQILAGFLLGSLVLMPSGLSARTSRTNSQQKSSTAKSNNGASASAKDAKEKLPFPQVPRITAEEVQRLMKDKGNVVLVDTDDSMTYGSEHIKGAVNIAFDPTVDTRNSDQMLSVLPGDKLIVFYCNCAHEEDSAPMVMEMWELGYDRDKVKALEGGLSRWEQLGYPLEGTDVDKQLEKGE